MGPWELGPNNPLWRNGVDDEVQNTGHADLVEDTKGQWWAVVLGVRPSRRGDTWEESVLGMLFQRTCELIHTNLPRSRDLSSPLGMER